jgi:hypothetical protein
MNNSVFKKIAGIIARSVCWGILGAVSGLILGLVAALLHYPSESSPVEPFHYEWYVPVAIILSVCNCLGGFLAGAVIGAVFRKPSVRRKIYLLTVTGAAFGVAIVTFLPDLRDDGLAFSSFAQAIAVLAILSLSGLWCAASVLRS